MKVYVVNLALLLVIGLQCVSSQKVCPGCQNEADVKDKTVIDLLNNAVTQQNAGTNAEPVKVTNITKVTKQVVSGIKYEIEFEAETANTSKKLKCKTTLLSRQWVQKDAQVLAFKCSDA